MAQRPDARPVWTRYGNPAATAFRFAGAGNAVPTAVANVPDAQAVSTALTRSNPGTLALNTGINVGVVQYYDANVHQPPSATVGKKTVFCTPPASPPTYPLSFNLQIAYMVNGANVDLAAGEELVIMLERTEGIP